MKLPPRWIAIGPHGDIDFRVERDEPNANYYEVPYTVSFVVMVRLKQGSRRKRLKFFRRLMKNNLTSLQPTR